jgi:subtilase family serine protease
LIVRLRKRVAGLSTGALALAAAGVVALGAGAAGPAGAVAPLAVQAPDSALTTAAGPYDCATPPPVHYYAYYHCYSPQDVASAYGIDAVHASGDYGQGQTIVLVDAYGSPTAASDLHYFWQTFYGGAPAFKPNFDEVYPQGAPDYSNTNGQGLSGPSAAANWSGEATLDIEWAYATAPKAHIVLLAVPPAETEGVQGLPNLFKAISWAVNTYPAGTVFSQSFGVDEPTFGGAAATQTAKLDQVYQAAAAKGDTVFASSGDNGTTGTSKQQKEQRSFSYPTVGWPASSPWVTAAGGTQLQYGWRWDPSSDPSTPGYFDSSSGSRSEPVWNEAFLPAASGGGPSAIYSQPPWQSADPAVGAAIPGDHRGVPDISWNAAVNGGVLVYITAYPSYQRSGWHVYGGTSAASPQLAGVIALANEQLPSGDHVGFLNPKLYKIGASDPSAFFDVTPGQYGIYTLKNNTLGANPDGSTPSGGVPGWSTAQGWDMTTGFGSPNVPNFVADLVAASK